MVEHKASTIMPFARVGCHLHAHTHLAILQLNPSALLRHGQALDADMGTESTMRLQSKQEQRRLVQQVIDAKSLALLQVLVNELKMNCSGCYLHAIVEDAPLQLLTTLLKASHSIDQRHPVLKTYVIHKVFVFCLALLKGNKLTLLEYFSA